MSGDFQIGEWCVQPAVNRLKRGDEVVRLEPKVMQVLVTLAANAGEVVTREELIARVWPDVFVTDDVLHRAIRELRRVFGDSTSEPRYIETIRKRGYRLIPATSDPERSTSDPECRLPAHTSGPDVPITAISGPVFSILAGAIALAAVASVVVLAMRSNDPAPLANARFVPIVSGPLNESDPALSPDGQRVAFVQRDPGVSASADIYIRNLGDGRVVRVTRDPASDRMPAWSPDAAQLAFIRSTNAGCDVMFVALAQNTERLLTACPNADDPKLSWTVDGSALLTSYAPHLHAPSGWRIARIDIATGEPNPLTTPPPGTVGDHSPVVSPDGRHFAFIRRLSGGVSDVFVAALDGTSPRRVTFDDADLTGIDWTGDGRAIVYSSDRAGGYSLWRTAIDGGQPTLVAGGAARMKHPVVDRIGHRVVYENWNYEINLWQAGSAPHVASPITRTSELWNLYPQVSPSGTEIAYVSTQSGSHDLWTANRDGSQARQLTRLPNGAVQSPRWSPDGRRIAYLARGLAGVDVHVVDATTANVTTLTSNTSNETAPAWTHDGARVLYGAADERGQWNIWSVDASGRRDVRLEIANAVAAQSSTDGTLLYFTRPDDAGLWRASRPAQTIDRILDHVSAGNTLGWQIAPDGIYFVEEQNDEVHVRRAPLTGGLSTHVATLSQFTWPGFSVTRDGAVLYARWDRRESNLMAREY